MLSELNKNEMVTVISTPNSRQIGKIGRLRAPHIIEKQIDQFILDKIAPI